MTPREPRAVEAAGIPVASETNASKWTKVFRLPAPHHPAGCERLVELTRKYPKDPTNACQVAMLKYWLGAARRTAEHWSFLRTTTFSGTQTVACYHLTEELFRHVLADSEGDVYPATLTALGLYWRDVLSDRTRCIRVDIEDRCASVRNSGQRDLKGLPVDLDFGAGRRAMQLVDVPAGGKVVIRI